MSVVKGGVVMSSVESYRRCAAQCLALSRKAGDPADRELLVVMAQRWLELAERKDDLHWPDFLRPNEKNRRRDH